MPESPAMAVPAKMRFRGGGAFGRDLHEQADAYFAGPAGDARDLPRMYLKSAAIITWFCGSWALLVFAAQNAWQATLLAISLGLSIAGIGMSVQHDANHGGYSKHPWVNRVFGSTLDVMGVCSFIWKQKHNVIHHTFTNVEGLDFDLDFGSLARLSPEQPRRSWHRYQHLYLWFFYGFLLPKWVLFDDFVILFTRRMGPHKLPRPSRGELVQFVAWKVFFLAWAVVIPAFFHPLWQVLVFHAIATYTLGSTLGTMFQLAHCVEGAAFPSKEGEGGLAPEFLQHQMDTTVDFARDNALLTWFLGGLSFQVEHHLFPKVCHLHYPALARIVEEVSARHGIPHRKCITFREAVGSHFRHLRKLGAA